MKTHTRLPGGCSTRPAYHPVVARWLIADLAEAALHTDRVAEARDLLTQVEATAGLRPAVWIRWTYVTHARSSPGLDDPAVSTQPLRGLNALAGDPHGAAAAADLGPQCGSVVRLVRV